MDLKECQKAVREGSIPNCIDIRELEMIEKKQKMRQKKRQQPPLKNKKKCMKKVTGSK